MKNKQNTEYNTDLAWKKIHTRFEENNLLEKEKKKFNFQLIMKIAAIFIVSLMLSGIVYYSLPSTNLVTLSLVETSSSEGVKKIKLSDGSVIYLSPNSKLYYPTKFESTQREIKFEGEAFFDIAKNPNKPFSIKVGDTEIKVLGTSFNINTKFEKSKLELVVKTGKVQVRKLTNAKKTIFLESGELALVEGSRIIKNKNENNNYLSWKTKKFNFQNVEMKQVIQDLNKAYNVQIVLENNTISKRKLRTKFKNTPLDTILKIIAEPYNLTIEKNGKYIILR